MKAARTAKKHKKNISSMNRKHSIGGNKSLGSVTVTSRQNGLRETNITNENTTDTKRMRQDISAGKENKALTDDHNESLLVSDDAHLNDLTQTNDLLKKLVKQLKKTESHVRGLEAKLESSTISTSSSSSTPKSQSRKKIVPTEIRVRFIT